MLRILKKTKFALTAALCIAALTVITVITATPASAADGVPLDQLARNVADIQDANGIKTNVLSAPAYMSETDPANPLNALMGDASTTTSSKYAEAYRTSRLLPSKSGAVVIQSHVYRFNNRNEANAVAAQIINAALTSTQHKVTMVDESPAGPADNSFTLISSEGTAIYWHVAARGRTLFLVMIEGGNQPETRKAFDDVLTTIPGT
jgi:hypothetical protein